MFISYFSKRKELITTIAEINVKRGVVIANELLPSLTNRQLSEILKELKQ